MYLSQIYVCRILVILALSLSTAGAHSTPAQLAQGFPEWTQTEQMPTGWDAAPPAEFLGHYETLRAYLDSIGKQGVAEPHWSAILDRAWFFLQNEQQITEGDLFITEHLIALFASQAWRYSDGRFSTLAQRYAARLATEGDALDGTASQLMNRVKSMRTLKVPDHASRSRQLVAGWLDTNQAADINVLDRIEMLHWMSDDLVPKSYFSARLTGFISLPTNGLYSFSRYVAPVPFHVDYMRVRIGDRLVLDTSTESWKQAKFEGSVEFEAGTYPIVIEYVYDLLPRRHSRAELMLLWDTPGGDDTHSIVPTSVFTRTGGEPGLDLAYFSNADLAGEPSHVESVPGLQFLQSGYFGQRYGSILSQIKPLLTDHQAVAQWVEASGNGGRMYGWDKETSLKHLTVEEVEAFATILIESHPDFVKQLRPQFLMMPLFYLFASDSDLAYRLIEVWGKDRQRPTTRAARFDLGSHSPYRNINGVTLGKQWMLAGLTKHRMSVYERVRDQVLANSDGSCNLDVLKLLAASHPKHDKSLYQRLDQHIQDQIDQLSQADGSGDAVATWYIAKAINTEYSFADHNIRLLTDNRPFEMAFAAADTPETRFWAFNEHAARLASVGQSAQLEALVGAAGGQFDQADQLAVIETNRSVAADVKSVYLGRDKQAELAKLKRAYENLEQRLQAAQARGDQPNVARYLTRRDKAKAIYDQAVAAASDTE